MSLEQRTRALELIALMSRNGEKIDALTLARKYVEVFGERIDWHEFSSYLDHLHTQGIVRIVQPGGWMQYDLARPVGQGA